MILGVLSDTHGSLHPRVLPLFRDAAVEMILHAGDVGSFSVLEALGQVAPVLAVRGNIDRGALADSLPEELRQEFDGVSVYMTHIGGKPAIWLPHLPAPRPGVAVCGHSHIPLQQHLDGVLFLNPGAAGTQPRFGQPLTASLLRINNGQAEVEIMTL